jgi:hypothetical protein
MPGSNELIRTSKVNALIMHEQCHEKMNVTDNQKSQENTALKLIVLYSNAFKFSLKLKRKIQTS